jgi:hypothetical protein
VPGTTGRPAEILRARGSIRVSASQQFQARGFYMSGCVSLVLAALKLTEMKSWSWWRVFLPLWVIVGQNVIYVLVGFLCLFAVRVRSRRGSRGAGQGPERPHCLPGRFAGVCSDFYGQLVEMARARRKLQLVLAVLGKRGNGGFVWDSRPVCTILRERYVKCRFYVAGGGGIPRAAHRAA